MLALCICSHHCGLIDCLGPEGEDVFDKRMGKDPEGHIRRKCRSPLARPSVHR